MLVGFRVVSFLSNLFLLFIVPFFLPVSCGVGMGLELLGLVSNPCAWQRVLVKLEPEEIRFGRP